ncbi:unnamed protein product [Fusarium venenatum]|uniref:Uncharacterized protein n=1 Tax=Fusarium venenatum TaxID=56646 RepID=A0A2L2SS41_9HYPO|nr:uncharacterized protein FVRRES_12791 [Fusarium venenatum]CEI40100.1 unnamed protein product [Fusarium venenatum]
MDGIVQTEASDDEQDIPNILEHGNPDYRMSLIRLPPTALPHRSNPISAGLHVAKNKAEKLQDDTNTQDPANSISIDQATRQSPDEKEKASTDRSDPRDLACGKRHVFGMIHLENTKRVSPAASVHED